MTPPAQATKSRTLTFDSQLIEDFLHTDKILVDGATGAPPAVFLNRQGESEALVICKNSQKVDEVYHVCREPLSDSGWNIYGLGAHAAAIAAASSDVVWAIGSDNQFWRQQARRWNQQIAPLPGGATPMPANLNSPGQTPVSVGTDGTVWAVDSHGKLYQYLADPKKGPGQWQTVACPYQLSAAPTGRAGSLWAIASGQIVQYSGGSWQGTSFPGWNPQQVCVGADGSVWAFDQPGNLYHYDQQWQQVAGSPPLVILAVIDASNVWGITAESVFSVTHFDGVKWQLPAEAPVIGPYKLHGALPQLSAAIDGAVWCLDTFGVLWKCMTTRGPTWQRQMMPTGMSGFTAARGVTEIVVGKDNKGPQAFYIEGGAICWAASTAGGTWRSNDRWPTPCSGLGITHQQDNGDLIVYGTTGDGQMAVLTAAALDNLQLLVFDAHGILKGARIQVSAVSANAWFTAAVIGGGLCVQWGNAQNPLAGLSQPNIPPGLMYRVTSTLNGGKAPGNLKELIRLPWVASNAGFYCCAVDDSGNIFMVFDISVSPFTNAAIGSFIPLTGSQTAINSPLAAVKSTSALIDAGGWTRIYATDAKDRLWVIRQTGRGGDSANPWTWTAWHPLQDNCLNLANGPGAQATRELFTTDADNFLNHLWQDPVSLNWNFAQLRRPTGTQDDPYYVSQYVTEITVCDEGGNPEPNVPVTVSAAEPVPIWVAGVQYNLDATRTATFKTNPMGKVTLSTLAFDLHTPQLTFQAEGFPADYQVYPPQNIQDRLAAVDGDTLQNAQARTQSVPTEVQASLVSSSRTSNCGPAATVIQNTFKIKAHKHISPASATGASLAAPDRTYAAMRAIWSGKVADIGSVAPSAAGAIHELGSWDSFWNDLAHFGEDVWHAIRKGVLELKEVVVDVDQEFIQLTVFLEGVGVMAIKYFIKTMDDVVHAITSAFCWLGAEIEKAIDWLKEFFSWTDILNTKTLVEYYITQVVQNVIHDLDPNSPNNIQQLVQAQFQKLIDLIAGDPNQPGSDVFSRAQTTFGSKSFNGMVSGLPVNPKVGSSGLHPDGARNTSQAHQVKGNYARTKTETHIQQGGKVMPSGTDGAHSGSFDGFMDVVTQKLDLNNPNSKYCRAQAAFQTKLQGTQNSKGFFETAINDFLTMVKDLVLVVIELLEDIVMELLKVAGPCLQAFQDILTHKLDIPIISWLYHAISHHDLTLLDLFCLVMAIPATLVYKLIWGGPTASPPFSSDYVDWRINHSINWPKIQGAEWGIPLPAQMPGAEPPPVRQDILGVLSLLNAIPYAFFDMGTDIDTLGPGEVDISAWLSGLTLILSIANSCYGIPFDVFAKPAHERTTADKLYAAVWGVGGGSVLLNVVSVVASRKKTLAKYLEVKGPVIVGVFGIVQLGLGIAAAVEYAKDSEDYNAFYSASAIVTPIPMIGKFLLLTKSEGAALVLVPLDLIGDLGSGACSLGEALSS